MVVYPNPTNGNITVSLNLLSKQNVTINLYNHLGQLLLNHELKEKFGIINYEVKLDNVPNGIFMIHAIVGGSAFNQKVVK